MMNQAAHQAALLFFSHMTLKRLMSPTFNCNWQQSNHVGTFPTWRQNPIHCTCQAVVKENPSRWAWLSFLSDLLSGTRPYDCISGLRNLKWDQHPGSWLVAPKRTALINRLLRHFHILSHTTSVHSVPTLQGCQILLWRRHRIMTNHAWLCQWFLQYLLCLRLLHVIAFILKSTRLHSHCSIAMVPCGFVIGTKPSPCGLISVTRPCDCDCISLGIGGTKPCDFWSLSIWQRPSRCWVWHRHHPCRSGHSMDKDRWITSHWSSSASFGFPPGSELILHPIITPACVHTKLVNFKILHGMHPPLEMSLEARPIGLTSGRRDHLERSNHCLSEQLVPSIDSKLRKPRGWPLVCGQPQNLKETFHWEVRSCCGQKFLPHAFQQVGQMDLTNKECITVDLVIL